MPKSTKKRKSKIFTKPTVPSIHIEERKKKANKQKLKTFRDFFSFSAFFL